ncbi:sigma-70 family RNA polymerase sigma factor [Bailinhaonella thermotolerans]|uniref:Sigma-70 family RNA polymerase sigma factor n=1 Tax=Bailinhaonella thermotolerans TaxID=1070861 RepID=A0A3A4ABU9_9ACTN|nr:sigma-70 family RNA polymerase sigma factor [Bailinhaonella thermotolerans]RJL23974.1 sigma-70 family RNA polymerase sigma factor [Bailinhaonella thermotolerans]
MSDEPRNTAPRASVPPAAPANTPVIDSAPADRPTPGAELAAALAVLDRLRRTWGVPAEQAAEVICAALLSVDSGTHRDRVCSAVIAAFGAPVSQLRNGADGDGAAGSLWEVYDAAREGSWSLPAAAVRDRAAGRATEDVLDRLLHAVLRFESCRHVGLVLTFSNRLAKAYGLDADDLLADGWHGLMLALRKYDPSRYEFSTYAAYRISGTIRDGIRAQSPIPKRLTTFVRKVAQVEEALLAELQRLPTSGEVAARMGEQARYLPLRPRLAPQTSLDELLNGAAEDRRGLEPAALVDEESAEAGAERRMCADLVRAALARLPQEQSTAVRLLHLDGLSLAEARQVTGLPARQLRAHAASGLASLRRQTHLAAWAQRG